MSPSPPIDEAELVARARRGEEAAFRALYDRHVERVFGLAFRMAGDRHHAEDLTQETFVRAFARIASFRGQAPFSAWLHAVARRTILNGLRRVARERRRELTLEAAGEPAAAAPGPDEDLEDRLAAAVDRLPPRARLTLVMYDVEGHTHDHIARVLGVTIGTSKAQLARARRLLRLRLGEP
jgi:RNA polymerase sigma-70 factor (ECF subfamily)